MSQNQFFKNNKTYWITKNGIDKRIKEEKLNYYLTLGWVNGRSNNDVSGKNNPMYGKHLSNEHKEKISKAHLGKKISNETKQKISKTKRERSYTRI